METFEMKQVRNNIYFILLLFQFFLNSYTFASEINVKFLTNQTSIVFIVGKIEIGDASKFYNVTKSIPSTAIIFLDSGGGLVDEALSIGRVVRLKGWATASAGKQICASACALIWLSGNNRYFDANTSKIGFHTSYINNDGKLERSLNGNAKIAAFLFSIGLSSFAIDFVTLAPPEKLLWLSSDIAVTLGIRILDENGNTNIGKPLNDALYSTNSIAEVAASFVHRNYSDGGMMLLIKQVEDCYKSANAAKEINELAFCYMFDFLAGVLNDPKSTKYRFPSNFQLEPKQIEDRLTNSFNIFGIGLNDRRLFRNEWQKNAMTAFKFLISKI